MYNRQIFNNKGITPAYAENTQDLLQHTNLYQDHPRIRGEYLEQLTSKKERKGSPPHTRRIPFVRPSSFNLSRITPAYAENTQNL